MLQSFCDWLAATPPSLLLQSHVWMVAATQSVHIGAIAIIACAILAIDLRLAGITRRGPDLAALERRFLPWIWPAAAILLISGLILVVGEPRRELLNWLFWTKMGLVVGLLSLTAVFQARIKADPHAWDASAARRLAARALGLMSMTLLIAVIVAGRWIAYVLAG